MPLAKLSIDLEAKLATFEQNLKQAAELAEGQVGKIKAAFGGIKDTAVEVGATLAGAFTVGALTQFVQAGVDAIDALNDVADATGDSVENISALEDVARRTGGSLDQVAAVLVKFNEVLSDTDPDSKIGQALDAIGLSTKELRQGGPVDALHQLARALAGYSDDADKARLVQALFGDNVREVAPLLKDLADQTELTARVTSEQAEQASVFNKQLADWRTNAEDLNRVIANALLPTLSGLASFYAKAARDEGVLKGAAILFGGGLSATLGLDQVGQLEGKAKAQAAEIERVTNLLVGVKSTLDVRPDNPELRRRYDFLNDKLRKLQGEAQATTKQLKELADAEEKAAKAGSEDPPKVKPPPGGGAGKGGKTGTARFKSGTDLGLSFEPVSEAQELALKALQDNDVVSARKYAEAIDLLKRSLSEVSADQLPITQAAIAKLTELHKGASAEATELAEKEKRLNALLEAAPTGKLEAQRKDMQMLAEAFERGEISAERFSEAAQARLEILPDKLKQATDAMDTFADEAARNIQDALGDTLSKTLEGDFKSIGDMWKGLLVRMAAEAIAADIGQSLFGKGGKGGGWVSQIFDFVGGLMANAKGNAFGSSGVQAFAKGDIFGSPTLFQFAKGGGFSLGVMGEAGPEAVMPLKRGRDGRLGVSLQGGGSQGAVVINNHYTFGDGVNRAELAAWGEQVRARTLADVHRSRNREGSLS
ncbi:hypothetical protein [Eleftheria terrae]|uniref:hypothetical protein n=1 Tax=Eleftheria terrae TaxID=1597781 RepID=UPI00263AA2EE|nr:hypothetical protein [Eleftheria terrae]WKB52314.1 hypothetical protein N7L95_21360 [Eleftheria terrae]